MSRKEAYTKAMVESIRNSGMWLKEARLLSRKGSKGHAQALVIFSGEELGKAMMCWMTINAVFPYNHWEVDFRNRIGVFRSHRLKNATALGFTLALMTQDNDSTEDDSCVDPWTGDQVGLRELLAKMGAFATWARSRWMYVDIEEKNASLQVVSPLNAVPCSVDDAIREREYCLKTFKQIVRRSKTNPALFGNLFIELRDTLMAKDDRFPENPEWE